MNSFSLWVNLPNSSLLDNPPQLVLRAMFRSFFWPALPAIRFLNKNPKVWLYGARPPPKVRLRVQKNIPPKFGQVTVSTSELANFYGKGDFDFLL
jgi:hypothetical protein